MPSLHRSEASISYLKFGVSAYSNRTVQVNAIIAMHKRLGKFKLMLNKARAQIERGKLGKTTTILQFSAWPSTFAIEFGSVGKMWLLKTAGPFKMS